MRRSIVALLHVGYWFLYSLLWALIILLVAAATRSGNNSPLQTWRFVYFISVLLNDSTKSCSYHFHFRFQERNESKIPTVYSQHQNYHVPYGRLCSTSYSYLYIGYAAILIEALHVIHSLL